MATLVSLHLSIMVVLKVLHEMHFHTGIENLRKCFGCCDPLHHQLKREYFGSLSLTGCLTKIANSCRPACKLIYFCWLLLRDLSFHLLNHSLWKTHKLPSGLSRIPIFSTPAIVYKMKSNSHSWLAYFVIPEDAK